MDDPVTCSLLPDSFLHQSLFAAEQLHGQLVVRRLEQGLKLILQEALLDFLARQTRARLLLRRPVEGHIVHSEVDLPAALVIHLVACKYRSTINQFDRNYSLFLLLITFDNDLSMNIQNCLGLFCNQLLFSQGIFRVVWSFFFWKMIQRTFEILFCDQCRSQIVGISLYTSLYTS